jgi:hypothetical protein
MSATSRNSKGATIYIGSGIERETSGRLEIWIFLQLNYQAKSESQFYYFRFVPNSHIRIR